jgi:outer membrane protein OmpA-like peptidoglycan-associated protein
VRLNISALNAKATGLTWPAAASPADLRLAAVVSDPAAPRGSRRQQGGTVDWRGRIALEPLAMAGALRVERFPLHALEPYFGGGFHASVQRAEGAWHGDVALRRRANGIEASASGDALVAELHVFGVDPDDGAVSQDELLSWRSLQVRGLKVDVAPDVRPRVDVGEAVVSDFYSQLVVTEEGRFNLRDVRAPQPGTASPPGGFAVGRQIAPQPTPAASAPAPAASAPATAASAPTTPQDGLPIDLRVGGLQLVNGRIDYTDRFVRPNYSAALSELNGRLGAFEAGSREMATLELDGRVAGTAQLEIRGSLNPTADPLALDVRAKASDLELAPLSPYAGKYAGYAIERGKLSMDVHYRVQPDGRLEASNRVVLNQLTFGERIESPDATKLPVRLAVALLKDRNGVIDVNLPVSGSINDPQFSVAGVVVRIIGNLIAKALTSPFSLLAGGGGEDLSVVAFRPGTAALADDASSVIDKVAKALQDRPALQMTVTGSADPAAEADAIRRASLERRVAAQRRNDAVRAGRAAAADVPMTPEERERVLRAVYRDTELPDKPRNVLGLEKDLSAAEMEALLLKHQPASPDAARELALQRGVAVRDALVAKGLPSERLFLAAPKLGSGDEGAPQAKLALSLK